MRSPPGIPAIRTVYRCVKPNQQSQGTVEPAAFTLREVDIDGLSVFHTALSSPRDLLQRTLDAYCQKLTSQESEEQGSGRRWLARNGTSVEEMLEKGWLVVELDATLVETLGLSFGDVEPDGHVPILGTIEQLQEASIDLADGSRPVLSRQIGYAL